MLLAGAPQWDWLAVFSANPTSQRILEMGLDFKFQPSVDLVGFGDCQKVLDAVAAKVVQVIREFEVLF